MPLPHPLLLFDLGARGMIPTLLPLAARGGSRAIAGTVEGAHPTDDRTEALMPETAAGSMRPEPWLLSWDPAHHCILWGMRGLDPRCHGCWPAPAALLASCLG